MLSLPITLNARWLRLAVLIGLVAICWLAATSMALAAPPKQATFKSPEEAADALVAALKANDERRLVALFGPE